MAVVHQLLPSFKLGDAMGQAALHFQLLLRRLGHHGELYAGELEPGMGALARPAHALNPRPEDWVLYHHGIASSLASLLVRLSCRRGVVFHNISPARFYAHTGLEGALVTGRAQLAAMAPHVELPIGVSDFNSRELLAAGYRSVHTVPLFVEPERFAADHADGRMARRLWRSGAPTLLAVGRLVAHKRCEDLLSLHEAFLSRRPDARLLFVGGADLGGAYYRGLLRKARKLRGVQFLGRLDHSELVAAYRASTALVSMSEHEGFCVPVLEAMASELPVLAYAAAAVPETLGGSGIAFTQKHCAALAEVLVELHEDAGLRRAILAGQRRRLEQLSAPVAETRLAEALRSVGVEAKPWRPALKGATPKRATRPGKPRVAIVVQRYGDVTGGAELHARMVAERLARHWELTVLTSCAKDHLTWENGFPAGETRVNDVRVLRFPASRGRSMGPFNALSRTVLGKPVERMREEHWVAEQGPLLPGLLRHLAERERYDGYLFFTYLYAPTAWGLPLVADRSILVPTAHDEEPFKMGIYRDVLERPRVLFCNTPEELELIASRYPAHAPAEVVGVGVEAPRGVAARFRERFGITRPYLLYVGRLEEGKGLPDLLKQHAALARGWPELPELVLAGSPAMKLPTRGVRVLGRITEQEKADGLAGAVAAVVPSRFESLSLFALEGFAQGAPLLAHRGSHVLQGQVRRSQAGATYDDVHSLRAGIERLVAGRTELGAKARAFANQHTWASVVSSYREAMDRIAFGR